MIANDLERRVLSRRRRYLWTCSHVYQTMGLYFKLFKEKFMFIQSVNEQKGAQKRVIWGIKVQSWL